MALTADIAATYRSPRAVLRRKLAQGEGEPSALFYLMLACGLIFVAQWPRLRRDAYLSDEVPFDAMIGGALMGWLFLAPLLFYLIAALSHLAAKAVGGRGSWLGARIALFWALLASTPLWLLYGLVTGFIGPGPSERLTGAIALAGFGAIWLLSLIEAERADAPS